MKVKLAYLLGTVAVWVSKPIAAILAWAGTQIGDTMSKEQEALDALDEALDRVEAWKNADDENDAAAIKQRTDRLNALVPANPSHLPVDQNGFPVDQNATAPGPAAPETSAPADEAPVTETEQTDVSRES